MHDAPAPLDDAALDRLFLAARTHRAWRPEPVEDATLRRLFEIVRMGPTSLNGQPARFVFVRSAEGKAKLLACLDAGNVEKTRAAPVTAIVAHDLEFWRLMARLTPGRDVSGLRDDPRHAHETAFRNAALQGAYLMLAARALGLDVGAMSGFDADKLDAAFFAGTSWRTNFLVNLGHGDAARLAPRGPRPDFEDVCRLI
jgi:3-hydroxypropanoate dehydrogenase